MWADAPHRQPAAPAAPVSPTSPVAPATANAEAHVPARTVEEAMARAAARAPEAATVGFRAAVANQGGDVRAFDAELAALRGQPVADGVLGAPSAPAQRPREVTIARDGDGDMVIRTSDGRTIRVERDANLSQGQIDNLMHSAIAGSEPPRPASPHEIPDSVEDIVAIVMICLTIMVVCTPLLVARLRRAGRAASAAAVHPDLGARLQRIEQAVETVAVEVERIGEAQRYSARLLAERAPGAAPDGHRVAEPVPMARP